MSFVLALNILFTIVWDAGYALIVGTLLAAHWVASGDTGLSRQSSVYFSRLRPRLLLISIAGMLIAHVVHPWFLAASMSGSDRFTDDFALITTILSSTHQGMLWYIDSLALAALGMAVFLPLRSKPIVRWTAFLALAILAFAKAEAGHAGADGDFSLVELAQTLHVLCTSVWAGAVIVSGLFMFPRLARFDDLLGLWIYGNRLSRTVSWALIAILLTGVYTSDRELDGSLNGLWTNDWGKILLAKIAFVSLAVSLGAMGRFSCLGCRATKERAARFVRLLLTESIVMILVLCLSGALGSTSPPVSGS